MWVICYVICLIGFNLINGDSLYPVFPDQPTDNVEMLDISENDIRDAFEYARQQASKRTEFENNYLAAGYGLSDSVSPDGRLFSSISNTTMQLHRIQEQFEDATNFLVKKYNLTGSEKTAGLSKLSLPDEEALVKKCKKLKETTPCNASVKYRTLDGSCNNLVTPDQGRAYGCFRRLFKTAYSDGISLPRASKDSLELPNPRFVSSNLELDVNLESKTVTQAFLGWGQIIAHDTAHTIQARAGDSNSLFTCCPQKASTELPSACSPIDIPENDSFYSNFNVKCMSVVRSAACSEDCVLGGIRHTVNQQSSFIDGSIIYGVIESESRKLRTLTAGGLLTQNTSNGQLPPANENPETDQCSGAMEKNYTCFQSGDSRINMQPSVTTFQTMLIREHNRVAEILAKDYPNESDEIIYQEARRIVGAEMQIITFTEFVPLLIGSEYMKFFNLTILDSGYSKYDPSVNPTITDEFTSEAFRFGHTMVQNFFKLVDRSDKEEGQLYLESNQDHPISLYEGKLSSIARGLYHQPAQDFSPHAPSSISNHLFEVPGALYGLDLKSIGIVRGREHGLNSYTESFKYCFNITISAFEELNVTMPEKQWKKLENFFSHVEDVDQYFSTFEEHVKDGVVGPLSACVIGKQFHDLKFGDRFYAEHGNQSGSFTEEQLKVLRKVSIARLMCDNLGIDTITPKAFQTVSSDNEVVSCKDIQATDFGHWMKK